MAEYIEREALTAELAKGTIRTDDIYGMGIMAGLDFALKTARSIPAADVVELVHAHWETIPGTKSRKHCTNCDFSGPEYIKFYSHCPNCGARMDGEG